MTEELRELQAELLRLSRQLEKAITYLREQAVESAHAEDRYRMAKAKAYLEAEGTVDARRATVDLATSQERVESHIAESLQRAALEAVRSRRQQISALQTLVSAHKAEAEFIRTGPQGGT